MSRTIAYFDCFSGISGDMVLGALLDAGGSAETLEHAVRSLALEDEVGLKVGRASRGHLSGSRVEVTLGKGRSRNLPELLRVVSAAALPARVKQRSLEALRRLGAAEARLHGVPVEELHLHELSGADTLVDLVGAFWLLEELQVEEVYCSPLPAERSQAGRELPLPAPAALELLAEAGAVLEPVERSLELVTPTGAAIIAVTARFERPALRPRRIGYGAGGRDLPGNLLRVWLGETVPLASGESVTVIETNLDDMAPNLLGALAEDLLAAGALDVSVAPVLMKKGRPGHVVTVLAGDEKAEALAEQLLRSSTTLGVRLTTARRLLAERRLIEVETELGRARVKLKIVAGEVIDAAPEYEDCRRLARTSGLELREVFRIVAAAARP